MSKTSDASVFLKAANAKNETTSPLGIQGQ